MEHLENEIVIDRLSYSYRGRGEPHAVFSNLSMKVSRGEFVTIVGPSGTGKTTLLLMIAGFIETDPNMVRVPDYLKGPAMVFQAGGLFNWLTVLGNVEFPMRIRGIPARERRERATELLRIVKLEGDRNKYPEQLSNGMAQRLELARAWAADTELILLDEPLSGLDYLMRCALQIDLQRLWMAQNKTIILVTHDPEEACFLSDRILVLDNNGLLSKHVVVPYERPRCNEIRFVPEFYSIREEIACL